MVPLINRISCENVIAKEKMNSNVKTSLQGFIAKIFGSQLG
jgi:hypothetical protein